MTKEKRISESSEEFHKNEEEKWNINGKTAKSVVEFNY